MKKIIISIVVVGLGIAAGYYWTSNNIKMFPTQAECEKKTGKDCSNEAICDYKCPRGFHKGWWMPREIPITIQESCAQSGERIGALGMPEQCCQGLVLMSGHSGGYTGECSLPPAPGGLSICSSCGNNSCEVENGENKCNCTQDCK